MPTDPAKDAAADAVLSLFEAAGPVETPTPGIRAYLAKDPSNGGKPVLIKRISGSGNKARATAALALDHPHIVRTRRWLFHGGDLFIVRDVVRGKNLRQTVLGAGGDGGLSPDGLRRTFLPLVDALEYAHGRGVAHGGIVPENVLIASEDDSVQISDWGVSDPRAPHHFQVYKGMVNVAGDIRALGRMLSAYLPNTGVFASVVARGRIEGVIARCDTLSELRATIESLEKFALPWERMDAATPEELKPFSKFAGELPRLPAAEAAESGAQLAPAPRLFAEVAERTPLILPGGGGAAALVVRNEGDAPLIVRMIATQHAWLNVRPVELPLTIAPDSAERVEFHVSAARLTPGEYRSEVYLSANAPDTRAEDQKNGWFRHTSEIRIQVGAPAVSSAATAVVPTAGNTAQPPHAAGCGLGVLILCTLPTFILYETLRYVAIGTLLPVK